MRTTTNPVPLDLDLHYRSLISRFYLNEEKPTPEKLLAVLTEDYYNFSSPELNQLAQEFSSEQEQKINLDESTYYKVFANAVNPVLAKVKPAKTEPFVTLLNYFLACYPAYEEFLDDSIKSLISVKPYSIFLTAQERNEVYDQIVVSSLDNDRAKQLLQADNDYSLHHSLATFIDRRLPKWLLLQLSERGTEAEIKSYLEDKLMRIENFIENNEDKEEYEEKGQRQFLNPSFFFSANPSYGVSPFPVQAEVATILSLGDMPTLIPFSEYGRIVDLFNALLATHPKEKIRSAVLTSISKLAAFIPDEHKASLIRALAQPFNKDYGESSYVIKALSPEIYAEQDLRSVLEEIAIKQLGSEGYTERLDGLGVLKTLQSVLTPEAKDRVSAIINAQLHGEDDQLKSFAKKAMTSLRLILPTVQLNASMSVFIDTLKDSDAYFIEELMPVLSLEVQKEIITNLIKRLKDHSDAALAGSKQGLFSALTSCFSLMSEDELESLAEEFLYHICRTDPISSICTSYARNLQLLLSRLSTLKRDLFIERLIARLEAPEEPKQALKSLAMLIAQFKDWLDEASEDKAISGMTKHLASQDEEVVFNAVYSFTKLTGKVSEKTSTLAIKNLIHLAQRNAEGTQSSMDRYAAQCLGQLAVHVSAKDKHLLISSALENLKSENGNRRKRAFIQLTSFAPLASSNKEKETIVKALLEKLESLSRLRTNHDNICEVLDGISNCSRALAKCAAKMTGPLLEQAVDSLIKQLTRQFNSSVSEALYTLLQDLPPNRWNHYFYGVLTDQLQKIDNKEQRFELLQVMATLSVERQQAYRLDAHIPVPELAKIVVNYCKP